MKKNKKREEKVLNIGFGAQSNGKVKRKKESAKNFNFRRIRSY